MSGTQTSTMIDPGAQAGGCLIGLGQANRNSVLGTFVGGVLRFNVQWSPIIVLRSSASVTVTGSRMVGTFSNEAASVTGPGTLTLNRQ